MKYPQNVISLGTGVGKTYIALRHCVDMNLVPLVVVHNENVLQQWLERIPELTGIHRDEIGILQGYKSLTKVSKDLSAYVGIHKTLASAIDRDETSVHEFASEAGIGIKIIDEAHIEISHTWSVDSRTNFPNNLYLSATSYRTEWREDKMMSFLMPKAFGFGGGAAKVAKDKKYHIMYEIKYRSEASELEQVRLQGRRGFDLAGWAKLLMGKTDDLVGPMVIEYYKYFERSKGPNLKHAVIVKTIEQAKLLIRFLTEELGIEVGNYTSATDKKVRRAELDKSVIVTTEKSLGVAMDTDIDVIHNILPMASKGQILQLAGRLRERGAGIFVSYVDESIEPCRGMGNSIMRNVKGLCKTPPSVFEYSGPGSSGKIV
jgi:superfamily II DNA or RNA helicase